VTDFAKDLIKDLRESRLWPVVIALVVALVAVPVLLSRPAEQEGDSAAPVQPGSFSGASAALNELKPIAEVKSDTATKERKSVVRLSARNPFEPLVKSGGAAGAGAATETTATAGTTGGTGATETTDTGSTGTDTGSTGGGSTGGGSTGSTGGDSGSGSGSSTTFYYTYVADVTFGKIDDTTRRKIKQLRALPSSEQPVIVFMGSTADGDKAVFLVGSGADVTGDGECKPSDEDCSFLYMKPGDSASIVVGDATGALTTYELKLHKITIEKLEDPPGASTSSAKARTAKQGAQLSKQRSRAKRLERAERRKARARAKGFYSLFDRLGF
jgi:hypothetical protein